MRKHTFIFLFCLSCFHQAHSASIGFNSIASQWENNLGTSLVDGNTVLIGNFDLSGSFDFSLIGTSSFDTFSEVSAFFTQYGSDTIETAFSTSGLQQGGSTGNILNETGNQIYFWAFNNSDTSQADQWAIVSNDSSNWFVPNDPTPGSTSIDLGDPENRTIEFGNVSSNLGLGNEFNVQTALVIPEPSTYAFLAGFLTFGYVFVRRRVNS